jgi:hypothetical protein
MQQIRITEAESSKSPDRSATGRCAKFHLDAVRIGGAISEPFQQIEGHLASDGFSKLVQNRFDGGAECKSGICLHCVAGVVLDVSGQIVGDEAPDGICSNTMFGIRCARVRSGTTSVEGGIFASVTDVSFCLPLDDRCGDLRISMYICDRILNSV